MVQTAVVPGARPTQQLLLVMTNNKAARADASLQKASVLGQGKQGTVVQLLISSRILSL
jgi:hypothetical protein